MKEISLQLYSSILSNKVQCHYSDIDRNTIESAVGWPVPISESRPCLQEPTLSTLNCARKLINIKYLIYTYPETNTWPVPYNQQAHNYRNRNTKMSSKVESGRNT